MILDRRSEGWQISQRLASARHRIGEAPGIEPPIPWDRVFQVILWNVIILREIITWVRAGQRFEVCGEDSAVRPYLCEVPRLRPAQSSEIHDDYQGERDRDDLQQPPRQLQVVTVPLALVVVVYLGTLGRAQSGNFTQIWPNSTVLTADLKSLTRSHPGNYLAEDYDVPEYYLENSIPWDRWFNTWSFTYTVPRTGETLTNLPAFAAAIQDHYFSLTILDFGDTAADDKSIDH